MTGVSHVAPGLPVVAQRIVHSIGTMSWIDARLFDEQELPEVDFHSPPPASQSRQAFTARHGYRFANFLEAYVVPSARQEIAEYDFTTESDLYYGPSYRGIMPRAYPVNRSKRLGADGRSAVFVQIVGCKTLSPEIIGAREGVKAVDSMLGIHPNWGGPLGVQAERIGASAGWKGGENVRVFPPIWTELELTIWADGNFSGRLVRYSLFPSVTYYEQSYTVERLTTDVTKYQQVTVYDARQKIDQWRSTGWGLTAGGRGAGGGNPWGVSDPRIISGMDVPKILAPGIPKE